MEGGFPFFEIIFFAMVAAFLVLRLRSVLGRRTGNEKPRQDPFHTRTVERSTDNVVALPDRSKPASTVRSDSPLGAALTQIKVADPTFDEVTFLQGAKSAFEMVVTAFANGDRDTLRPLTSVEIFANLEKVMREREEAGHTFDSTLVGMKSAEIIEAELEDRHARVTVKFVSEQVNVTRDGEGQVVSGSANVVDEVTDIWTFERDSRSRDPNWRLVETRTPE